MENVQILNILENDEIVFHLVAMTQCEQGGEGHRWDSSSWGLGKIYSLWGLGLILCLQSQFRNLKEGFP
jgi:hypothetical protein